MSIFSPYRFSSTRAKGFTLVELVVTFTIIGILGSIVFVALNNAHIKSRDTQRAKDIETLQGAVEVYRAEHGHYPISDTRADVGFCTASPCYASFDSPLYKTTTLEHGTYANLAAALGTYLPTPLKDPIGPTAPDGGYLYKSAATGGSYCILFYQTPENMNNFPAAEVDMSRCGSVNASGQCAGTNNIYVSSNNASGC